MQNSSNRDTGKFEEDVRSAVEQGYDVQEKVRQLTLRLISSRSLDIKSVRDTAETVLRGARAGVQKKLELSSAQTEVARAHLKQAVTGLDIALAQFAEAARLTVEEAAGRAQKYSSEDLRLARADIEKLEKVFMETLQNSASAARDAAGDILHDLAAHIRNNGSAIGGQLKETLSVLASQISAAGRAQAGAGLHLARNTADMMRQIAAGVLVGVADHVRPASPERPAYHDEKSE